MNYRADWQYWGSTSFVVRRAIFLALLLLIGLGGVKAAPLTMAAYDEADVSEMGHDGHEMGHSMGARLAHPQRVLLGTPTINLLSPADGATLNVRDVEVRFEALDAVIGPIGTPHFHLHLDNDPIPFMFFNGDDPTQFGQQAVLFDFDLTSRATWVTTDTVRFNALTNGEHTLMVHLVDGQHNILDNPEASAMITFAVDVPSDDALLPEGLVFVKEQPSDMGRVFDNDPDIVSDLYLLSPVAANGTLYQLTDVANKGGGVSDPEVSWDGERIVFAMKEDADETWHIYEINVDGTGLRKVTSDPLYDEVNDTDPEYLPDGNIIFASDRLKQRDEYDVTLSTQLYTAHPDGTNITMVEPNPSHSFNPQVIRDGRIVFDRWDHLAHRNIFTNWHMNPDGSSGFVFFGGASPRGDERLNDSQGLEHRQLETGEMVGIFTHRTTLPGVMAVYDNRNGDLEDLPKPITFGPEGLYRTPNVLTTYELVYSYSAGDDPATSQFALYTMPWTPEALLVDDTTVETAPGPGTNIAFRTYDIELEVPSRLYVEVTGSADDNGDANDDDLWVAIDGTEYNTKLERRLDGDLIEGLADTFRVDADLEAGSHLIQIVTNQTPTLKRVRIMRAIHDGEPTLLYDDPNSNEVSPIPVRVRTLPPIYPSKVNFDLSWGTFLVRDISLRGDFRQTNHDDPEGEPDFHFHLELEKLKGLRVFQSVPRRDRNKDILVGAHGFDPVRVLGVAPPNEFGTTLFQAPANNTTAWDLIGHDGESMVHERVWSLVQPGEIRACGGCHVPQLPFVQREIGPIPPPTDLRTRGEVYTFVDHALPVLQENCQSCHTGASPAGGLDLLGNRTSYDALLAEVEGRVPAEYVDDGDTRLSFLFQLLLGDARGNSSHQTRIDEINADTDHTSWLTSDELYDLGTWIDTSAGFAYLVDGEAAAGDGPEVVGILPAADSTNVPQNSGVVIEFNAPIDRATLDETTFSLLRGGSSVAGTWQWGDNLHVTFQPDSPLASGEYHPSISGQLLDIKRDLVGDALSTPFSSHFTVGSSSDTTAPQVAQLLPDGVANPTGPIGLRFDEPIDPGTISELTLWVEAENGAWVEGRVGVSWDGMEAIFAPRTPFEADASYTLHLSDDIRDLAGNALQLPTMNAPAEPALAMLNEGESYPLFLGDAIQEPARQSLNSDFSHPFTIASQPSPQHHSLIAQRDTGNSPEKVAVNADGTRILVANEGSDSVSLYDGTTWELLETFADVGDNPFDVAFSPDSKQAYILNNNSDDVRIVRLLDGTTLATISGLLNPHLMGVNHAGTRLYVVGRTVPYGLYEIDVDSQSPSFGQLLRSMTLTKIPYDVVVSPDDQLVYVSADRALIVIDVPLWAKKKEITTPYWAVGEMALSPDGRQAVVTARSHDFLQVIDLIAGQYMVRLELDEYPESVVYTPDGRFIYVTERDSRTIAILDVTTLAVVRRLPAFGAHAPEGLAIAPDSSKLYVVEDGSPGRLRVFTMADLNDNTPPEVSQVLPANNATNIPLHTPLRIDFSEALDRLTVNAQTILLEQNGTNISGLLRVTDDNQTVWFQPSVTLQANTTYALSVTSGVEDLAGNPLAAATLVSFTTAVQPDPPPLGVWATPYSGDEPRGAAVTPDGLRALSTDYWGHRLYLIDTTTWQSSSLDLEGRLSQITVRPDGLLAYVLRSEDDMVMVVDLTSDSVIDMDSDSAGLQGIPVGDRPDSLLYDPTQPRLYVVNRDSSDVSVIDTQTHQESARWPVNGVASEDRDAHGAALSPDGQQLYVTSRYRLSVLDTADGHLIKMYEGLPGWSQYGVVVTAEGNQVWFTSESTDELIAFDLRLDEIVARVPVGDYPTWLALSPDGETIYVNNQNEGSVSLVQWRTGAILNTVDYQGYGFALAASPDGERLYVANNAANGLLVYEYADPSDETSPVVTSISPAHNSQDVPIIEPLIVQFNEALDRASVNSSTFRVVEEQAALRQLLETTVNGQYLISPDNRTVTFLPNQPWHADTTYTLQLSGGLTDMAGNPFLPQSSQFSTAAPLEPIQMAALPETFDSDEPWGLAMSPDGSLLAVSSMWRDTVSFLDPETMTPLGEAVATGDGPRGVAFNNDGSRLYVVHEYDKSLVEVDVSTRQVLRTITGLTDGEEVLLSLDNAKAYITGYDSNGVDEVDLATGQVSLQVQAMTRPGRAAYAPNGTLYVPSYDALWRLNGDGTWSSLATGNSYTADIAFSADGRHAYLSQTWSDRIRIVDLLLWERSPFYDLYVGDEPRQMAQSSDGRLLVVANSRDGTIQLIDTFTHTTVQTTEIAGGWLATVLWDESRERLFVGETTANILQSFELTYSAAAPTVLAIDPPQSTVVLGQPFTVTLQVRSQQSVDGAAAHLNFDPNVLQVLSITPGDHLPNVLQNNFDNTTGQLDFVAGTLSNFPSSDFVLASVAFNSITSTPNSDLTFASLVPRRTDVTFGGLSHLHHTETGSVEVGSTSFIGSVTLQGRPAPPSPRWSVPLTVEFVDSANQSTTFTPTSDENGTFALTGIQPGSYNVHIKNSHTLQNSQTITVVSGDNNVRRKRVVRLDFGTLREGDANNDNYVTLPDFSILATAFGKCGGMVGYDNRADFNQDTCVTIADFSLLATNFGQGGNAAQVAAPRASTTDVSLIVAPTSTTVNRDETFTIVVQVQTDNQNVDGAQVTLNFDPTLLKVEQLIAGDTLPLELQKEPDNANGTINFAAGALSNFPNQTFDLLQIEFMALAETEATPLTFELFDLPHNSDVTFAGASILTAHTNGTITIDNPSSIRLATLRTTSPSENVLALVVVALMVLLGGALASGRVGEGVKGRNG